MRLKLFQIVREDGDQVFMAAASPEHSATVFLSRELDEGRDVPSFTTERIDHKLPADRQLGLDDMLSYGPWGVVVFDPVLGWGGAASA